MLRHGFAALRLLFEQMDRSVPWLLAAANVLAVAGGLLSGLAPLALKHIVDTVTDQPTQPSLIATLTVASTAYLACLGLGRVLGEVRPMLTSAAEQRLFAGLRTRFFGHALRLPLTFHLSRQSGAFLHSLQQAITGYQIVLFSLVNAILPILVEIVTVTWVLHSLGQSAMTATFALTALAYLAAMAWFARGLAAASQEVVAANAETSKLFTDGLINVEPIKCFGTERWAQTKLDQASRHLERRWRDLQRQRLRAGLTVTAVFTISMAASLVIAIRAVDEGVLTMGGFVLATIYMVQIMRPLEMLATASRDLSQGMAFIGPLRALFELPSESPEAEAIGLSQVPPLRAPSIRFEGVCLAFNGGGPALHELTLEIPAGRAVALVGASGCGKSSLVRLLLRLCEPQAGRILLDDVPIHQLTIAQLRAMVAVVPQDTVLFNTTIAANIAVGKQGASLDEITRAARLARLHETVRALPFGYDTVVGERGLTLSGGERQRIAIARAILRDPLVYIFDEATSMLDGPTEAAIFDKLRELSSGRTTIVIAHRLSAVQHIDDILVLANGKVAERGDHTALLRNNGIYAAMWRSQAQREEAARPTTHLGTSPP